jgi:rare lipoprotein A (peptidoglycan hydrolase)
MRKAPIIRVVFVGLVIGMAAPVGQGGLGTIPGNQLSQRAWSPAPAKPYQVGVASWYGERHQGRTTANGESFDMFQLTAAHRHLPLGSLVRVTYLGTRRSVVVRINDRGPARENVIVDLSYAAALHLGFLRRGLARVRLDLLDPSPKTQAAD